MPIYDYQCELCGHKFERVFSIHEYSRTTLCPMPTCNHRSHIIITQFPGVTHGMVRETHYNKTVGKVVSNDTEFKSELSRQSDVASERNQFPVSFQPIDHHESKEHLGVTDEGLDSQRRQQVDSGQVPTKQYF